MGFTIAGREYGLNPIRNIGNVAGTTRDIVTETGKETASRIAGGNSYDIRNPFATNYRTTPNTSAVLGGNAQPAQGTPQAATDQNVTAVLGANTDGGYGYGGSGSNYYSPARINAINAAYDTKIAGMRQVASDLTGQEQNAQQQVGNLYGQSLSELDLGRSRGNRNLDVARGELEQNQARTLRDLAANGRNLLQAARNNLGTWGASDSSAADHYAYALANAQNRNRSDVQQQASNQYNQINMKRQDLENDYTLQKRDLDTWKANKLLDIAGQFNSLRNQIIQDVTATEAQKQMALTDLMDNAAASLGNVDQQYRSAASDLISSINNTPAPQTNAAALNVNYNPTAFNYDQAAPTIKTVIDPNTGQPVQVAVYDNQDDPNKQF